MAREYAYVYVSIWGDGDFRELSDPAQSLYFKLMTAPSLNRCGVADWRPNRLTKLARGLTVEGVQESAHELCRRAYLVIDEDTEEVLVRSFIRRDKILASPNMAVAMRNDFAATASATIRSAILRELARLHDDQPDLKGWEKVPDLVEMARSIPLANPSANPSGNPDPNPSGNPSVKGSPSFPSPLTPTPSPEGARKRASRLPDDWLPSEALRDWARERFPSVDLRHETEKFVNHWTAKSGKDATKMSWDATWRNWIIKASEWGGQSPNGQSTPKPWTPPPPPPEVAADPKAYAEYMRTQRAEHARGSG